MKVVTLTQLRRNLREIFEMVKKGETIYISKRGELVAKLVPLAKEERNKLFVSFFLC